VRVCVRVRVCVCGSNDENRPWEGSQFEAHFCVRCLMFEEQEN